MLTTPSPEAENLINGYLITRTLNSNRANIKRYEAANDTGKVLLKQVVSSKYAYGLLEEGEIVLKNTSHPALPEVVNSFEKNGSKYLVLKWQEGKPLEEAWNEPGVTIDQQLEWLEELCLLVSFLNKNKAFCIELNLSDILISDLKYVVVRDFSLLQRLPFAHGHSIPVSPYIAPEIYQDHKLINSSTEVYAIGALWLSLIAGRSLEMSDFENHFVPVLHEKLRTSQAFPFIARFLLRSLAISPTRRFESPTDLAREVRQEITRAKSQLLALGYTNNYSPVNLAAWSDPGPVLSKNRDSYFTGQFQSKPGKFSIAAVAGAADFGEGGDIASTKVIEYIKDNLPGMIKKVLNGAEKSGKSRQLNWQNEVKGILRETLQQSYNVILDLAFLNLDFTLIGCTVVIAVIAQNQIIIANIGNCRAYLFRDYNNTNELIQLSQDHIWLADQLRTDPSNSMEAVSPEAEKQLSRFIGGKFYKEGFFTIAPISQGNLILLTSDGLTHSLSDDFIASILEENSDSTLAQLSFKLLNASTFAGGTDNSTVVLYKLDV